MSHQLINLSPDLKKLRDEGYEVGVISNHLIVKNIPYVNSNREVKQGMLVSTLILAGDKTARPDTHVVHFVGDYPCNKDGVAISKIKNSSKKLNLGHDDLVIDHSFSSKPEGGYMDYYEKMTTYAAILSSPAHAIDASVTPKTFGVIEADDEETVFEYVDTASSRAEINIVTQKLELEKVAIVGLGGTGSYVLDLIVKTPIKAIYLFDGDLLFSHNVFRAPGAASIDELRKRPKKVNYFKKQYSKMHRNIIANDYNIDSSNVQELLKMDFVFLCLDNGNAKKLIVKMLEENGMPYVEMGMGLYLDGDSLAGVLRVTTSTENKPGHVRVRDRIPFSNGDVKNEYSQNIQIAELNAFSAVLAVMKYKKIFGFYKDYEEEHFSTYTIDGNTLTNEDKPC